MKKKLLSLLATISIVLSMIAVPHTANAATVTVSSKSALNSALSSATAGTEIIIKNGTYNDWDDIHITKSGTADKKIVVRAETPGGVRFTGKITFYFQGSYEVLTGFYFDQIHFDSKTAAIRVLT